MGMLAAATAPVAWRAALHPTLALHPQHRCYGKTAMAVGLPLRYFAKTSSSVSLSLTFG